MAQIMFLFVAFAAKYWYMGQNVNCFFLDTPEFVQYSIVRSKAHFEEWMSQR